MRCIVLSRPALLAVPAVLAACAPSAPLPSDPMISAPVRAERRCFQASQVNNFRADQQAVYIRVGQGAVYELSTTSACLDIGQAFQIALIGANGGSSLCVDDPVTLASPGRGSPTGVCRARIERQLTAEQIAALPDRLRP